MNACLVLPASSQMQQMLVDHEVKKVLELLSCAFAMYDCRQLNDVSSIENVHMVTKILSRVFIRCCHLHLPSLSSVAPQAFGALEPSPSNTSMHPIPHGLSPDHLIIFVQ